MRPTIKYDSKLDKVFDVIAIQQNLNITCEVKGWPKPDVKWYKDKQEVTSQVSRANTDFGELFATLTLKKIKRDEGGAYTIIAENEVGRDEANFVIRVLDVPMPPENLVVAEISSYSCKLKWSPPKDDGNVPILGYYIEKLDPKRGSYIRLDKTSLTEHYIDKLDKGHSYQFRVIAENKIGLSEPCEMREPCVAKGKHDVPGAPGMPEISEISQTGCRVAWEAPKKDGGTPVRGYYVEKKSGSKWIRVNKEPVSARYLDLKDLLQGNDYEFRVCAVNDEGEGPFSKVINFSIY
jgi:titin